MLFLKQPHKEQYMRIITATLLTLIFSISASANSREKIGGIFKSNEPSFAYCFNKRIYETEQMCAERNLEDSVKSIARNNLCEKEFGSSHYSIEINVVTKHDISCGHQYFERTNKWGKKYLEAVGLCTGSFELVCSGIPRK